MKGNWDDDDEEGVKEYRRRSQERYQTIKMPISQFIIIN